MKLQHGQTLYLLGADIRLLVYLYKIIRSNGMIDEEYAYDGREILVAHD